MTKMPYPDVNDLIDTLLTRIKAALGDKLIGVYLYGSLVTGDFDLISSDVDLLVAIADDLTDSEFAALDEVHGAVVTNRPQWKNRIEIAYVTVHALRTFKTERLPLAIISPGEPFHFKEAGIDWLMNWYMVREKGLTLYGTEATSLIAPITQAEFLQAVYDQVCEWRDYLKHIDHRSAQSYVILTMCRARYALTNGEQTSKIKAAAWAQQQMPEWAGLIADALVWRQVAATATDVDHAATLPITRQFVHFVIDLYCA